METKFAETGLPCPCGTSSDAYSVNEDGSGKCFSCSKFFSNGGPVDFDEPTVKKAFLGMRGISSKTMETYGVYTKIVNDIPTEIGFKYPNEAYKIRNLTIPKKEKGHFRSTGKMSEAGLYGRDKFDPGSKESITITEGEFDALAAFEMLRGRSACVSLRSSSSVEADVRKDYEYINSFKKIYLALDKDGAGQEAVKKLVPMFDFNKVYILKFEKYKDANDYLANREVEDFVRTWENARRYSPSSIISSFSEIRKALTLKEAERVSEYPFADLSKKLFGIHKGEFILAKGLQGIGKTEWCRAIVDHTLKTYPKTKIATVFLEESQGETIRGVATYQMKVPVMRADCGIPDDEIMDAYAAAVKTDDRLYIHSHFSGDDESEIIDNIRFLVTVAGVDLILLDNLTMLNTGREGDNDERLRIDRIIRRLRALVNELKFALILIAHTNDDGTTRGSRLPDIVTNTVINMERIKPDTRLDFIITKARTQGAQEGPAGFAIYNRDTGILADPGESEENPEF